MAQSAQPVALELFCDVFTFLGCFYRRLSSLSSLKRLTVMQLEYKNSFIQLPKLLLGSLSATWSQGLPGPGIKQGCAIPRIRLPSAALPGNFSTHSSDCSCFILDFRDFPSMHKYKCRELWKLEHTLTQCCYCSYGFHP